MFKAKRNDNKKKLLVVIWHMGIGGMQKRLRDIFKEMDKKYSNWQIFLLVKHEKESFLVDEIRKNTKVKIKYFSKNHTWSNSIFSVFWLIKNFLEIKPDVVLTFLDHLSVIMIWLKTFFRTKTKIILNESMLTSKYIEMSRGKFVNLWKFLVKISYFKANLIIVPTLACKNDLVKNFLVPFELIKIIPNWTLFKPSSSEKYKYDVVFVGRLEYEKGILSLIKIAKELSNNNIKCLIAIVGGGECLNDFKNKIENEKLKNYFLFLGYSGDVRNILLESKMLVLPTLNEGLPNVVLEAGMCGVPVVVNRFDGVEELIENNVNGFICQNVLEMEKKIEELLEKKTKRKLMGQNLQKTVIENFNQKRQDEFIEMLVG